MVITRLQYQWHEGQSQESPKGSQLEVGAPQIPISDIVHSSSHFSVGDFNTCIFLDNINKDDNNSNIDVLKMNNDDTNTNNQSLYNCTPFIPINNIGQFCQLGKIGFCHCQFPMKHTYTVAHKHTWPQSNPNIWLIQD